jgi:two-component system chemotaxis response regulator CheB
MPQNALARVSTEHVLPAAEIGPALDKLVRASMDPFPLAPPSPSLLLEDRIARDGVRSGAIPAGAPAAPSGYTCPDCQGALLEVDPGHGQYRCRIGHAWSAEALLSAHDAEFQRALWTALRSLDEKAALATRLEQESARRGHSVMTGHYASTAQECTAAAETLRRFLLSLSEELGAEPEAEAGS